MALRAQIQRKEDLPEYSSEGFIVNGYINIVIYNSENGQITDGDYLNVQVVQVLDGIVGNPETVTVIGRVKQLRQGVLRQVVNGQTVFDIDYRIMGVEQGNKPAQPPQGGPTITEVQIIKKADINGAHGAVLTVASSPYMPLSYYIDDIPLPQQFNDITTGYHVAKVIDANGNEASLRFYVPQVQPILVSDPGMSASPGNVSRWNAAFNPIMFTYRRNDFDIIGVEQNAGNAVLHLAESMAGLPNGHRVYVNAGVYKGTFTVKSVTGTRVEIERPYSGDAQGYLNSDTLRPYYKVKTEISYTDEATSTLAVKEYSHSPNPQTGMVEADVSGFLKTLVQPVDGSNYTQANYRDANLAASYTVRYQETWEGMDQPQWIALPDTYYVTYSAMQVQAAYGGNMAPYVPFKTNSHARFVTDFAEPAYSYGYPFDLGFIYGEDLAGLQLYSRLELLDINRNPLPTGTINSYLLNEDGSFLLNTDGSRLIIASQTFAANVLHTAAVEHVGLNRLLINGVYPNQAYYLRIALCYNNAGGTPVQVTESKIVRIDKSIDHNSVYLRWLGYSGSWEYYRFVWNQEISLNVQNAVTIKKYGYDYQNTQGFEETVYRDAAKGIKVFAEDLSVADIKGLQSIKTSPKVQWLSSTNPMRWQTVTLGTGNTVEYETQMGQYAFNLQFTLPAINVQTQ